MSTSRSETSSSTHLVDESFAKVDGLNLAIRSLRERICFALTKDVLYSRQERLF